MPQRLQRALMARRELLIGLDRCAASWTRRGCRSTSSLSISSGRAAFGTLGVGAQIDHRLDAPLPVGRLAGLTVLPSGQPYVGMQHRLVIELARAAHAECRPRCCPAPARSAGSACGSSPCVRRRRSRAIRCCAGARLRSIVPMYDGITFLKPLPGELHEARGIGLAFGPVAHHGARAVVHVARQQHDAPVRLEPLRAALRTSCASNAHASIASGLVPAMPREPPRRSLARSCFLNVKLAMSKTRYAAGATSSSRSGGPSTCSGAMTISTSAPSGSGAAGIWSACARRAPRCRADRCARRSCGACGCRARRSRCSGRATEKCHLIGGLRRRESCRRRPSGPCAGRGRTARRSRSAAVVVRASGVARRETARRSRSSSCSCRRPAFS